MKLVRCTILLLLLTYTNNNVCMIVETDAINTIPTLQQLCIKTIATCDIHNVIKKDIFERYSNLPESLKNKIAKFPMFFKLEHEFEYTNSDDGKFDCVCLDEDNNHVHLINAKHKKLKIFKMGEVEKINSFKIPEFCRWIHKRSLMCWFDVHADNSIIHFLKNGREYNFITCEDAYPYKILNNQRTLYFRNIHDETGNILVDLKTRTLLIQDFVREIQCDINETLCLIKDFFGVFTLYDITNPAEYQKIQTFNNINNAVINPNGKQILISTQHNTCAFVSIKGKTLFEIKNIDINFVHSDCFNDTGDYVITRYFNQEEESRRQCNLINLINTNNGITCFFLLLFLESKICFYKKFLTLIDDNDTAYLIRIKDLPMINNKVYTLEDIKELNIGYSFENVNFKARHSADNFYLFHPSGKYIVTIKDKLWKLIHIKSKECVATCENVKRYRFSEPTGKMLYFYIKDKYSNENYCNKVFHCRNDFTLEEVFLNRFITENNTYQSVFSKFSFSRKLTDKDK